MTLKIPKNIPSNFCIAPFISTRPEVRHKNSPCAYGALDIPQPGLSPKNKWNSKELNQLRQDFIDNKQPDVCERCWQEERAGKESLRQRTISYNPTAYEDLIVSGKWIDGPMSITFKSSNVCNLACRSCGAHDSNQFDPEGQVYAKEYGDGGAFVSKFPATHVPMEEWIPVAKNLERLEFFGGEPLLNITQYEILQYLVDSGRANQVELMYNSNATNKPTERLREQWKHFKSIDISLSIDGIESRFEYLRYPGKWETVLEVIEDLKSMELGIPTKIFGNMTMSTQNVLNLKEIMDWQKETFGSEPWIGFAEGPDYMNIRNFPNNIKEQLLQVITRQEVKDYMMLPNTSEFGYKHFLVWMKRMDNYREQSFADTFTHLYDIIKDDFDSMDQSQSIV